MSRIFEILISLAMIGIGALGWLESLKIKGFAFDSLGSRAVPQTLSALLLLAGFWVIVQGFLGARMAMQPAADVGVVDGDEEDDEDVEATGADYVRAVAMFVFSFIFVYAVFVLRIPLSLSVLAFTVAGAQLLVRGQPETRHLGGCARRRDPRIWYRVDLHQLLFRRSSYVLVTPWTDF